MSLERVNEEENRIVPEGRRVLSYAEAVRETLLQSMERDPSVFIMGQGVNDPTGMLDLTTGLWKKFGTARSFDTPLAETGMSGIAVGAAMSGMRPVYFHNRPDFLMLAMDQIVNHASKYCYMSAGQYPIPLIIWAVTGKGWGSAAQHSQALHGLFMHVPGLKIVMPTTPYDAKGLLASALEDHNPVLVLDHRSIHAQKGFVPEELYTIPFGKGVVRREGTDITLLGISAMAEECLTAVRRLEEKGISAEVLDLRTLKPFDLDLILRSVRKTRKLLIADTGWKCGGVAAEIGAQVYEQAFDCLEAPICRVALPDLPTPAGYSLEEAYYKDAGDICEAAERLCAGR